MQQGSVWPLEMHTVDFDLHLDWSHSNALRGPDMEDQSNPLFLLFSIPTKVWLPTKIVITNKISHFCNFFLLSTTNTTNEMQTWIFSLWKKKKLIFFSSEIRDKMNISNLAKKNNPEVSLPICFPFTSYVKSRRQVTCCCCRWNEHYSSGRQETHR